MKSIDHYNKGLLFLTYLLISSDKEISDNELYYLHKMRVEEGMTDDTFVEYFTSLIGKSEKEIYQIGIDSLNLCSDELKIKAFSKLNQMAISEKVLSPKEIRFIFYAIKLSNDKVESFINRTSPRDIAA